LPPRSVAGHAARTGHASRMSSHVEPTIRLSVIDRLLQNGEPEEANSTWVGSVDALKASLVRDLEWLLNTRRIAEPAPDSFPEVQRSVYHFGLPDVSSRS